MSSRSAGVLAVVDAVDVGQHAIGCDREDANTVIILSCREQIGNSANGGGGQVLDIAELAVHAFRIIDGMDMVEGAII